MSLGLIKNDLPLRQKRVLPRFPFSFLTFRPQGKGGEKVYEVRDISSGGMQLCLKEGQHPFQAGENLEGTMNFKGEQVTVHGTVRWVKPDRLGVEFLLNGKHNNQLHRFLGTEHLVAQMRPLHNYPHGMELPANLKYWLRADGPIELFVWCYPDGEMSRFQLLILNHFVEWEDGIGSKTGTIVQFRDRETPLFLEDEILLEIDNEQRPQVLQQATEVIRMVSDELLPNEARQFMVRKLTP